MTTMTRKEALQSLREARLSVEAAIRQAKTITRAARRPAGTVAPTEGVFSDAQSQLHYLRKEATLIYTAIAALRGKLHSVTGKERLEALAARTARGGTLKDSEKIALEAFKLAEQKEVANASAAA